MLMEISENISANQNGQINELSQREEADQQNRVQSECICDVRRDCLVECSASGANVRLRDRCRVDSIL